MDTITYSPMGSTDISELKRQLTTTQAHIESRELQIAAIKEELSSYPTPESLAKFSKSVAEAGLSEQFASVIAAASDTVSKSMTNYEIVRGSYRDLISRATQLKSNIANNAKEVTLSRADVNAILSTSKHYVPDSVALTTQTISWVLKDVLMTPDNNYYRNINNGERKLPGIKLPPITVSLRPRDGELLFTCTTEDRTRPDGFNTKPRAHPHIMSRNNPCLGGFENAVASLIMANDLESLNHVITMFLQQANAGDSAGKYWPEWLFAHTGPSRRSQVPKIPASVWYKNATERGDVTVVVNEIPIVTYDAEGNVEVTQKWAIRDYNSDIYKDVSSYVDRIREALPNIEWIQKTDPVHGPQSNYFRFSMSD